MTLPLHELAALGTAACWAITGVIASDAVRAVGPFYFNLLRQGFVTVLLIAILAITDGWQAPGWGVVGVLAVSGIIGILIGDTFNFAAVGKIGPRRAAAVFALNAPMAAILGWAILDETLPLPAVAGICITVLGVALAILGRPATGAHRLESVQGALVVGVALGLMGAFGQAAGSLIARPVMTAGLDPYMASLLRVGASGMAMGLLVATPFAPPVPRQISRGIMILTAVTAMIGLLIGMTLFLYALQGSQTGIIATLSATSPVLILPLLWVRTGQRPSGLSWCGAALAVGGLALIFSR